MKKKIALVTGGYSSEAEISYQSVITVNNNVDRNRYDVYVIDITPEEWFYKNENGEHIPVDKNDFSITLNNKKINFDACAYVYTRYAGRRWKTAGLF